MKKGDLQEFVSRCKLMAGTPNTLTKQDYSCEARLRAGSSKNAPSNIVASQPAIQIAIRIATIT
jgi:hypothetical protein